MREWRRRERERRKRRRDERREGEGETETEGGEGGEEESEADLLDPAPDASEAASQVKSEDVVFEFHVNEVNEEGEIKAWFVNREGETEWTEFETDEQMKVKEEKERRRAEERRKNAPAKKHCCLPLFVSEGETETSGRR